MHSLWDKNTMACARHAISPECSASARILRFQAKYGMILPTILFLAWILLRRQALLPSSTPFYDETPDLVILGTSVLPYGVRSVYSQRCRSRWAGQVTFTRPRLARRRDHLLDPSVQGRSGHPPPQCTAALAVVSANATLPKQSIKMHGESP